MAFAEIAYFSFFGVSLLMYLGILSLALLIITAIIGYRVFRGKTKFQKHKILAILTIVTALIHGFLALASRIG